MKKNGLTFTCNFIFSPSDLLHFKSGEIAEQMTLIDAELFQRIEVRGITHTITYLAFMGERIQDSEAELP